MPAAELLLFGPRKILPFFFFFNPLNKYYPELRKTNILYLNCLLKADELFFTRSFSTVILLQLSHIMEELNDQS